MIYSFVSCISVYKDLIGLTDPDWIIRCNSRLESFSASLCVTHSHGRKCITFAFCSPCSDETLVEDAYHCGPEEVIGGGDAARSRRST